MRLGTAALIFGYVISMCIPIEPRAADEQATTISDERAIIDRFAYYVNNGLIAAAASCFQIEDLSSENSASLEALLAGARTTDIPRLIVAKREYRTLPDGSLEMKCVMIWNVVYTNRPSFALTCKDRFVIHDVGRRPSVIQARAVPIILQARDPQKVRDRLQRISSE